MPGKKEKSKQCPWKKGRLNLLQVLESVVGLDFSRFILQSTDYDCIINLITQSLSLMLENPDIFKDEPTKQALLEVFCVCISKHERGPRSRKFFF